LQSGGDTSERDQIEKKLNQLFNIDDKWIMLKSNADKFAEKIWQVNEIINQIMTQWNNPLLPQPNLDETTPQSPTPPTDQQATIGTPPQSWLPAPQGVWATL
jgi:hypothetical protein